MAGRIWRSFLSLFRRSDNDEEDKDFVPSPMDVSVRVSHGGSDDEIQRELDDIERQAEELDDHHSQ